MNSTALRRYMKKNSSVMTVYIVLVVTVVVGLIASDRFLTPANLGNVFEQAVGLGIVSMAQALIILTGGIDLSLGALISTTCAMLSVVMADSPLGIIGGILLALAFGIGFGALNGWGITTLKVPPFAMTLATMSVLTGIALIFRPTPGGSIPYSLTSFFIFRIGVIPVGILLMAGLFAVMIIVLGKTRFGRNIYAVGGNERTAQLSGINTKKVKVAVYALAGLLAAVSGLYLTARMGTGDATLGKNFSLDSITVCVLGGLSLMGGVGKLSGIVASTFVMTILNNILNLVGVDSYWQYALKGIILILIVLLYAIRDQRENS